MRGEPCKELGGGQVCDGQGLWRKVLLSCATWFPKGSHASLTEPRASVSPDGRDLGDGRLKDRGKDFCSEGGTLLSWAEDLCSPRKGDPLSWEETREEGVEQAGAVAGGRGPRSLWQRRRGGGQNHRRAELPALNSHRTVGAQGGELDGQESVTEHPHPLPPLHSPEAFRSLSEESERGASE